MSRTSRPRRGGPGRRPMERNRVAWTLLQRLALTPTDPGWKEAHTYGERRRHQRPAAEG